MVKYICCTLCCVLPSFGFGQVPLRSPNPVSIGVKVNGQMAGIANQNNYGQNEMDYKANAGYGAGLVASYHLTTKTSIQTGISYQSGGQKYLDRFKGREFKKEVQYGLIAMPLAVRHNISKAAKGYSGVGSEAKPLWYVLGGLQVNRIISPEVDWYLDGVSTDFLSFVLEGGNPNSEVIEAMGPPAPDSELFVDWDLMFIAGSGFQIQVSPITFLTLEMRGGIALTDLNANPWRLDNHQGTYAPSRNMFLGLHAGVQILLSPLQ